MPELAPPEPIPVELAPVEQAFTAAGRARFLDLSGRFTFEDRKKLADAIDATAAKTGGRVLVLALPGKTDVNAFAKVHADLKLQPRDVLFVFSQEKRHLHSTALGKATGNEILKATNKDFYASQTDGILKMLGEIETRLGTSTATTAPSTAKPDAPVPVARRGLGPELVLLPVAIAAIAWLLLKTRKPTPPAKGG